MLNCVVSTDNFLKTGVDTYRKSVLISPAPINKAVKERLEDFIKAGIRVICYSSADFKGYLPKGCIALDINKEVSEIFKAIADLGYSVKHKKLCSDAKIPTMTVSRFDNGFNFSVYNTNTTTETHLKFPLGAPILMCGETEIRFIGFRAVNIGNVAFS